MLTDNVFRPSWVGVGARRLKNAALTMEWLPRAGARFVQTLTAAHYRRLTTGCGDAKCELGATLCASANSGKSVCSSPADAAARALKAVVGQPESAREPLCAVLRSQTALALRVSGEADSERRVVVLSLAEAESLRRLLHGGDALASRLGVAIRTLDGRVLDRSPLFVSASQAAKGQSNDGAAAPRADDVRAALFCVQFINNNMYYTDKDLSLLEVC